MTLPADLLLGGLTCRLRSDTGRLPLSLSAAAATTVTAPDIELVLSDAMPALVPSAALALDGEGEYDGYLDLRTASGLVRLTSEHPGEALANCLRRVAALMLPERGGVLLHAACILTGAGAVIFSGRSGDGKSTVCRLSGERPVVADDITAVRHTAAGWFAWGLPDRRGTYVDSGQAGPHVVRALYRLVQDRAVYREPVTPAAALAAAVAIPAGVRADEVLALTGKLVQDVPCYDLHFREDPSFWECVEYCEPSGAC